MPLDIKISNTHKLEAPSKFIPRDKPLMSFQDAFNLVKEKYRDAFDYLEYNS